jgi:YVTN family beta-propeller protein
MLRFPAFARRNDFGKTSLSTFLLAVMALAVVSGLPLGRANASASYGVAATMPVSGGADFIAADPANNLVYVSGQTSNTVTVINGSTNAVATTISLAGDAEGIAVNPTTNRVYVANGQTGTLTVIDGSKNTVTGTISLPVSSPFYVAVNPNTNTVYVLTHPNQVAIVDGATNTVTGSITISNIYNTGWISVNPNTNTVYVVATHNARGGGGMLTVIDGATNTVAKQVEFGGNGFYVSVNPATNTVYAASGGGAIFVFDGSTNTQTGTISVGASGVSGVSVNPTTNTVFGTSASNPGQLYVIDGASSTLSQTITLGNTPFDLSVNPNTNTVYVANEVGNTVSVVDETTGATAGIVLGNVQSTPGNASSAPYQVALPAFNLGTGSNRLLVVGVSANNNVVTSITFGGAQLTQAVSSFNNNDAEFWYLVNPSGTGDIVVTFGGPTLAVVGAYAFAGVSQSSPIPTTAASYSTAASSPSISITTQHANSWVLDLPSIYGGVFLDHASCTQGWDITVPDITGASSSAIAATPGQVTCGWTATGGELWDDVAVEIMAAP